MADGRKGSLCNSCRALHRKSFGVGILFFTSLVLGSLGATAVRLDGTSLTSTTAEEILRRLHYTLSNQNASSGEEQLTVVNLDLLPDDVIATEVEDGVQEEFDHVDRELGDAVDTDTNSTLPEHRINRQMSLIYQGVYVPDPRFNPFVDGVMVNMMAEMKRKQMDPLYFRVHKGGGVKHVPTRQKQGAPKAAGETESQRKSAHSGPELQKDKKAKQDPIGGGVIRGLTRIKRFGNAEIQTVGNATLVRSHYVLGPLDVEFVFETTNGVRLINSTLTALPGHGLARVNSTTAEFLDFIIDSPANYEIKLRGSEKNERLRRLSRTAILKLVRREGRLERRLMRMFNRAGRKPLPRRVKGATNSDLWPTKTKSKKEEEPDSTTEEIPQKELKFPGKKAFPAKKFVRKKLEKLKEN